MASHDDVVGGMPRAFLRPILLLLLAEQPSHGYDLLERVADFGLERLDAGGLYRTLRAMEQDGLVESWWEDSTAGPARRSYSLTDDGRDWLHLAAGSMRETAAALVRYLDRYGVMTGTTTTSPSDGART